jgi:hypothetical protein
MDSGGKEVIPGITESDIDKMADLVFGRVDGNHPDTGDSSGGIGGRDISNRENLL